MSIDPQELRTARQNAGRFTLQTAGERWRVVEWSDHPSQPQTPRSDWTDHASADALRDRLCRGLA